MIGTINIEVDLDLQTALESFSELWNEEGNLKHLTVHVIERTKPLNVPIKRPRDDKKTSDSGHTLPCTFTPKPVRTKPLLICMVFGQLQCEGHVEWFVMNRKSYQSATKNQ